MRFIYHQPIPNFYSIENPNHPNKHISGDLLKEFRDIAIASGNNMRMFKEGLNLGLFMIQTSIENLPFKSENEMLWLGITAQLVESASTDVLKNAFDMKGKFIRKACTAHKEAAVNAYCSARFIKGVMIKLKKDMGEW